MRNEGRKCVQGGRRGSESWTLLKRRFLAEASERALRSLPVKEPSGSLMEWMMCTSAATWRRKEASHHVEVSSWNEAAVVCAALLAGDSGAASCKRRACHVFGLARQ